MRWPLHVALVLSALGLPPVARAGHLTALNDFQWTCFRP